MPASTSVPDLPEVPLYSNFDHAFDGTRDQVEAGTAIGAHAALNFYGLVWRDGAVYREAIRRHHSTVATLEAPTIEELIRSANDQFGSE